MRGDEGRANYLIASFADVNYRKTFGFAVEDGAVDLRQILTERLNRDAALLGLLDRQTDMQRSPARCKYTRG